MVFVKVLAGKGTERFPSPFRRINPFDWASSGILRDENRDLRVAMATAGLTPPEPAGLDVVREAGLRDPPRPPGRRLADCCVGDIVRSKDSHKGDLTVQNGSLSRHATLYAVVVLGLGLVATTLVLLALLLF
jgi:hypothetical protein